MLKNKCNHIIGIWYENDNTYSVNIDNLKEELNGIKNYNKFKKENGYDDLLKEYTLEDCFNKNCDSFELFNYCPYCGEEIKLEKVGSNDEC